MKLKETDALLKLLFDTAPYDFQSPQQVTVEMRRALGQAYAIPGFKEYLENAMNQFILTAALKSDDMESLSVRKGRILTLKGLLEVSRTCFHDYNQLKQLAQKDAKKSKK
jgi:hypothetical protein